MIYCQGSPFTVGCRNGHAHGAGCARCPCQRGPPASVPATAPRLTGDRINIRHQRSRSASTVSAQSPPSREPQPLRSQVRERQQQQRCQPLQAATATQPAEHPSAADKGLYSMRQHGVHVHDVHAHEGNVGREDSNLKVARQQTTTIVKVVTTTTTTTTPRKRRVAAGGRGREQACASGSGRRL
jgi:hypothetical protein